MKIKTSRLAVFKYLFVMGIIYSIPIIFLFLPGRLLLSELILLMLAFYSISSIFYVTFNYYEIEITEDETMIGSESLSILKVKKQHFVSQKSLEVETSLKRSFYQKITGQYKIYDHNGLGFQFNRYHFSKQNFQLIQQKIQQILGITIN